MNEKIYNNWLQLREESIDDRKEKLCYCGHTFKCECSNPDLEMFNNSVANNTIIIDDPKNGWS